MAEVKLTITEKKVKDKTYKNINLREQNAEGEFILNGNHVLLTKTFPEGMKVTTQYGDSYSCKAKMGEDEVSFFLNEKLHAIYKTLGGVDDVVKVSGKEVKKINYKTKAKNLVLELTFEKVE